MGVGETGLALLSSSCVVVCLFFFCPPLSTLHRRQVREVVRKEGTLGSSMEPYNLFHLVYVTSPWWCAARVERVGLPGFRGRRRRSHIGCLEGAKDMSDVMGQDRKFRFERQKAAPCGLAESNPAGCLQIASDEGFAYSAQRLVCW